MALVDWDEIGLRLWKWPIHVGGFELASPFSFSSLCSLH